MQTAPDTTVFRAISHPTRRAILDALAMRDRNVGELCAHFDVTQPAVSQHLDVLRDAGLVRARASGRQRIYSLEPAPLQEVFDWTARFEAFWHERLDRLGDVLDRQAAT